VKLESLRAYPNMSRHDFLCVTKLESKAEVVNFNYMRNIVKISESHSLHLENEEVIISSARVKSLAQLCGSSYGFFPLENQKDQLFFQNSTCLKLNH